MRTRIEVTFSSGKFVAFDHVQNDTIKTDKNELVFKHGPKGDSAHIFIHKVDFIEFMEREDN